MDEEKYSFQQISRASGMDVQTLERNRRNMGMIWDPKGYTLAQVERMTRGCALPTEKDLAGGRSNKVRVLNNLLREGRKNGGGW